MNALALVLFLAVVTIPPEGIIHVRRGGARGHACAVRADILLTAEHVVGGGTSVAWSDLAGHDGTADEIYVDPARDLAVLRITRGTLGGVWALAKVAPHRGDRVRIAGYADDNSNPAKPQMIEAKVVSVDAGHVDYNKSAGEGASGSCVLNDADEVVAINFAHMEGPRGGVLWATGVSVYGAWAPEIPKEGVSDEGQAEKGRNKPVSPLW